ncbi:glucarate dehydratase [bacterium]|nr:glucarate dehydratase [bacterium]
MIISNIKARTISIPIEAPTRHSYGSPDAFVRTIVEVETDEGLTGLGETCGWITDSSFDAVRDLLIGEDPFNLEKIRVQISQRGYLSRQPMLLAPIEFACYDIQGQSIGRPVYQILGGKIRERVPLSAYLFYRYPDKDGKGEVTTPAQMVSYAKELVRQYGFRTLKLKGGVFEPEHEFETIVSLREEFGGDYKLRLDPNATWAPSTAIRVGNKLRDFDLEYYEDPAWGLSAMANVRRQVSLPLATNMSVIEFEQIGPAVSMGAVDVILTDPWYYGGLLYTKYLDMICKTFGLSVGMHSGTEFGIGLTAMLHVAVTMPNLVHAIDSHYHHLNDDVLVGGMLQYKNGCMSPSDQPGLGVRLDEDKMSQYEELFMQRKQAADYWYPPDPKRPDWYPIVPSW